MDGMGGGGHVVACQGEGPVGVEFCDRKYHGECYCRHRSRFLGDFGARLRIYNETLLEEWKNRVRVGSNSTDALHELICIGLRFDVLDLF